MNDFLLMEIANEIKGLHNVAIEHIRKGEYVEAATKYRTALIITEKIHYYEGMAITLFSMANLAMIVGDFIEAINNAADANLMFEKANIPHEHCSELLSQASVLAKKMGIEHEKKGRFQEAIDHFTAAVPFADEKSSKAMIHEIGLLRKILDDRANSRDAKTDE